MNFMVTSIASQLICDLCLENNLATICLLLHDNIIISIWKLRLQKIKTKNAINRKNIIPHNIGKSHRLIHSVVNKIVSTRHIKPSYEFNRKYVQLIRISRIVGPIKHNLPAKSNSRRTNSPQAGVRPANCYSPLIGPAEWKHNKWHAIPIDEFQIAGRQTVAGWSFRSRPKVKHAENKLCTHFAYECARLVGCRFSRETV